MILKAARLAQRMVLLASYWDSWQGQPAPKPAPPGSGWDFRDRKNCYGGLGRIDIL